MLVRSRDIVGPMRGALQTDDVATQVRHIEPRPHVAVVLDVAELQLVRLAVDQNRLVLAYEKPDGHADRTTIGLHGRQPCDEVAVQASVDVISAVGRLVFGQFHSGGPARP